MGRNQLISVCRRLLGWILVEVLVLATSPAASCPWVLVSGYAVRDQPDHEAAGRLSSWTKDHLHKAAAVDLGCAAAGVLVAAQLRFDSGVTRSYLVLSLALPVLWVAALWLAGKCLHNVIAVGHEPAVAALVKELWRDRYHGLAVVGACVAGPGERDEVAGVPVYGGLDDITAAVKTFDANTVMPARRHRFCASNFMSMFLETHH